MRCAGVLTSTRSAQPRNRRLRRKGTTVNGGTRKAGGNLGGDAIEKLDRELNRLSFYQAELGMSGNVSWMGIMR